MAPINHHRYSTVPVLCCLTISLPPEPTASHSSQNLASFSVDGITQLNSTDLSVRQHLASCLALANKRAVATCAIEACPCCCTLHANIFSFDPWPSSYYQRPSACRNIFVVSVTNFPPSCAGSLDRRPWHVFPGERGPRQDNRGFQRVEAPSPLSVLCSMANGSKQLELLSRASATSTSARGALCSMKAQPPTSRRARHMQFLNLQCFFPQWFSFSALSPDAIGSGRAIHAFLSAPTSATLHKWIAIPRLMFANRWTGIRPARLSAGNLAPAKF